MNKLSPQRKRVVLLAAAVACMSSGPVLLKDHPRIVIVWIAVMFAGLVLAMVEFAKLKRQGL